MPPPCPICGSPSADVRRLAPLPFKACSRCGFVFRFDRTDAEVHESYEGGDYTKIRANAYMTPETVSQRRADARVRLDYLRPYVSSGALLDVGTAGGLFVAEALERGFVAEGLEPTPEFAAFARDEIGVPVLSTTVEEAGLEDRSLDVVTLWHVLEHIPDPVEVLGALHTALRPGGVIGVEVPNAGGYAARLLGRRWSALEPEVHVNQFGVQSLREALERTGFVVEQTESVTYRPYMPEAQRRSIGTRARRAIDGLVLRSSADPHPSGHELLRAVGRRAA